MATPPFNIFSARVDPAAALRALQGASLRLEFTEGQGSHWKKVRAHFGEGLTLSVNHSPEYYADESWQRTLPGMFGYFLRAPGGPPPVAVLGMLRSFRFALSCTGEGMSPEDPRWPAVLAMCQAVDGAIFVPGVLLDAQGRPLFTFEGESDPQATLPARAPPHPLLEPKGPLYAPDAGLPKLRVASCAQLQERGFAAAYGLPHNEQAQPRPLPEIARRLCALGALFLYVARLDKDERALRRFASENGLREAMTEEELSAFDGPRDQVHAALADTVGWRLENMWPLAWALGFDEEPPVAPGMIDPALIKQLLDQSLPQPGQSVDAWLAGRTARRPEELLQKEDLFYCAHHAVRAAQRGLATVPWDFHPVVDGGVIHERRHAFTWMVSPGVSWDDTDLST
jgi:hypothetical protein